MVTSVELFSVVMRVGHYGQFKMSELVWQFQMYYVNIVHWMDPWLISHSDRMEPFHLTIQTCNGQNEWSVDLQFSVQ